jgi:hypothetical protein
MLTFRIPLKTGNNFTNPNGLCNGIEMLCSSLDSIEVESEEVEMRTPLSKKSEKSETTQTVEELPQLDFYSTDTLISKHVQRGSTTSLAGRKIVGGSSETSSSSIVDGDWQSLLYRTTALDGL